MGGSSSKEKKSRSKAKDSHSIVRRGSEKSNTKKAKSAKKTKQTKNVKIQDENSNDQNDGRSSPISKIQKSISFTEKSKIKLATPPIYRKKSMCHPLDAKDLNFEELRTRSGSDKSLRFSDFNKLVRQTTLYEWEMAPADIPLYHVPVPRLQSVCYICGVYTGSLTRACRVCYQVYHDGCLMKIGHALNKKARQLTESNAWSCHQCSVLSHLLTREDVQEILSHLQNFKMNPDGIALEDYVRYYEEVIMGQTERASVEGLQSACESRFKVVDENNVGSIEFEQFLDLVAFHILHKRDQCTLVHILTEPELAKARAMYIKLEESRQGEVTTEMGHHAINEFDKSIKDIYRPSEDSIAETDDEKRSPMSWGQFLCTIAIHFFVRRPNYSLDENLLSVDSTIDKTQSLDSLDETYKSCCSEVNSSFTQGDGEHSKDNLDQEDKKGTSMLDEIAAGLPLSSGNNLKKVGEKDNKMAATEADEKTQEESIGNHLWTRNPSSRYRDHPNFSQHVVSYLKPDSSTTEKEITVLNMESERSCSTASHGDRRSEIVIRPENQERLQKRRAVSQKVIAPSYGRLVDRVQQDDWC